MLAKKAPDDLSKLKYPQIVQPKLDGVRCSIVNGVPLTRSLKDIPNREIREYLSKPRYEGLDGEIIIGDPKDPNCIINTTSYVMAYDKTGADWKFHVFDIHDQNHETFVERAHRIDLYGYEGDPRIEVVEMWECETIEEVLQQEGEYVAEGHEGVILRDPDSLYKFGRSGTLGPCLKLKRFIDFEAEILDVFELMHNANEAKKNNLGRTERSTAKDGLVGKNMLGGFKVRAINGPHQGQEFSVGTGFSEEQRKIWWHMGIENSSAVMKTRIVKIKSCPTGAKDAPRFPVFIGFRDMSLDG